MDEGVGILRRVELDDPVDVGHVEAARSDVGAEENAARSERQVPLVRLAPCLVRHLAVQRAHVAPFELAELGEDRPVVVDARAGEEVDHQLAAGAKLGLEECHKLRHPLLVTRQQIVVGQRRRRGLRGLWVGSRSLLWVRYLVGIRAVSRIAAGHRRGRGASDDLHVDADRVTQARAHELEHLLRLRGAEEARAPLLGQPRQDGVQCRLEPHVKESVRLIEN
mmetsp:Transcript_2890/g.6045  ORF Transcript_2890/g.6045 Transcript_2890/m.6045 type:complete len:222 (-) Transcript_2890:102-767(-)